jgi:hypothetical protein
MRCEYQVARDAIGEMYRLAKSTGDSDTLVTALMADACTRCWVGDFQTARERGERLIQEYDDGRHKHLVLSFNHDPKCLALIWREY